MNRTTVYYVIIFALILAILLYVFKRYMKQVLLMPLDGIITSPYGPRKAPVPGASTFHNGIDIAPKQKGDVIKAPLDGTIYSMFTSNMGGLSMIIQHEVSPGVYWTTGYADLSAYASGLKAGDKVTQGQTIGLPGSPEGKSTGVHVHFTLKNPKGETVDPAQYINKSLTALA